VARKGDRKGSYRVLVGRPEEKRSIVARAVQFTSHPISRRFI
jgi:hypothetical protein